MALEVFQSIDPNTMILGLFFVILFTLIQLFLGKSLKNRASVKVISVCVSLLAVYGLSRTSFDASRFLDKIGIGENVLYTIVPIIIIVALIWIIWKLGLGLALMVLGGLLIISSFFVYEKGLVLILGIALLVIGFILYLRRNKKKFPQGGNSKNNSSPNLGNVRKNNLHLLKKEAKIFNRWAKSQSNPKFAGSWANFIWYLKKNKNWGNSEAAICQTLGISQNDLVSVFNRYGIVN